MKKAMLILAAAVSLASLLQAQEETTPIEVTGADELVERKGELASTWVRPDADITRYDKLVLWQPEFQFHEGGETTAGTTAKLLRGDAGPYAVREEDQERFKQQVSAVFVAELERTLGALRGSIEGADRDAHLVDDPVVWDRNAEALVGRHASTRHRPPVHARPVAAVGQGHAHDQFVPGASPYQQAIARHVGVGARRHRA